MFPRFYPILDTAAVAARSGAIRVVADVLLEAGVKILQYRHKDGWTQREYDDAEHLAQVCKAAEVPFLVNDRADYAALLGSGVHLGQDDLSPMAARTVTGPDSMVGLSTHNKRQLLLAADEPVQYVALGPIFATTSKLKADPVLGLDRLKGLRPLTDKPLVAIGGITLETAASVFAAGAASVAILSGFLTEDCQSRELKKKVKQWLSV